jgi:hypothetical protein
MPTTTKMGIVYPASTDLVKDGATAMGTISTTIDAKTGLVFLNTTTFTGVTSASFPTNTFTSAFTDYRVIIELTNSAASGNNNLRFRTAGSDNTNANYQEQRIYATGSSAGYYRAGNATSFGTFSASTSKVIYVMDILNPQATSTTLVNAQAHYALDSSTAIEWGSFVASFNATTSFDSMSLYASSSNITGSMTAFGYNQ